MEEAGDMSRDKTPNPSRDKIANRFKMKHLLNI